MDDREREDRAVFEALAALAVVDPAGGGAAEPGAGEPDPAAAAAEARAYTEILGVLPRGLEPVAPSPEVRRRLMAAVRAGAGTLPFRRPALAPATAGSAGPAAPRWPLALAAALAALALGLAGWLGLRVAGQAATIAELTGALSAAGERSARLEEANAELTSARAELSHRLALATSLGMVACPLKPMDDDHPEVRGLLFMSPGGGPWLVSVHDLEPAPEGAAYVLWFLGGGEPRRAGVLAPGPDRAAQMTAETMPGHEAMTGVALTLEPSPQAERPSGPMLLFGDQRISIL